MNTRIKDLSIEELKTLIGQTVDSKLKEYFGDPDLGLEIRPEVIQKIRRSRRRKLTVPAERVAVELGLKW